MFAIFTKVRATSALLGAALLLPGGWLGSFGGPLMAQAPANVSQVGTVKSISGNAVTLTTDKGQQVAVTVADGAKVLQLAPGNKDLKTAQAIALTDVAAGDRILVTGKPGDSADQMTAARVILMKSTDIAQQRATEQADWQKRGSGGIVSVVDKSTGTVTISSGAKKIQVQTSGTTVFRRYAGDSVKFEDAQPSTLAQIQPGDQMRVRGAKSDDGSSIQAEEIVSGSFKNLAGTIATLDANSGTITLKDLATKKNMTIKVTANSDLRRLPERAAAMFAARARGVAPGGAGASASAAGAPAGAGGGGHAGGPGGPGSGGPSSGGAGRDLSQMLSRLPNETIADLKVGEAVMIVASQADTSSSSVTAVTLLSGVEPILAATPGAAPMTLSPWSVGGSAPGGEGSN